MSCPRYTVDFRTEGGAIVAFIVSSRWEDIPAEHGAFTVAEHGRIEAEAKANELCGWMNDHEDSDPHSGEYEHDDY